MYTHSTVMCGVDSRSSHSILMFSKYTNLFAAFLYVCHFYYTYTHCCRCGCYCLILLTSRVLLNSRALFAINIWATKGRRRRAPKPLVYGALLMGIPRRHWMDGGYAPLAIEHQSNTTKCIRCLSALAQYNTGFFSVPLK